MSFTIGLVSYIGAIAVGFWLCARISQWRARHLREQDEHYLEHGE